MSPIPYFTLRGTCIVASPQSFRPLLLALRGLSAQRGQVGGSGRDLCGEAMRRDYYDLAYPADSNPCGGARPRLRPHRHRSRAGSKRQLPDAQIGELGVDPLKLMVVKKRELLAEALLQDLYFVFSPKYVDTHWIGRRNVTSHNDLNKRMFGFKLMPCGLFDTAHATYGVSPTRLEMRQNRVLLQR